jgi:hypothetical protein
MINVGAAMLNYEDALREIENFMIHSRIRDFCTTKCKGLCCGPMCYNSTQACHVNEGRRLKCSYYICRPLMDIIIPKECVDNYKHLGTIISNALLDASNGVYKNPYFFPYTKEMIDNFRIEDDDTFKKLLPDTDLIRQNFYTISKNECFLYNLIYCG